jgi:hypothetical protein
MKVGDSDASFTELKRSGSDQTLPNLQKAMKTGFKEHGLTEKSNIIAGFLKYPVPKLLEGPGGVRSLLNLTAKFEAGRDVKI